MTEEARGATRRDVLRRGGGVALATVWMTPVIQSIGGAASAGTTGSPAPTEVLPTKEGRPGTGVAGTKLPNTGNDSPILEVAVIGAGLVATGAAVRKIVKRGGDTDEPELEAPA
jgi:LPXTG-motif cell wall-anchored protein